MSQDRNIIDSSDSTLDSMKCPKEEKRPQSKGGDIKCFICWGNGY